MSLHHPQRMSINKKTAPRPCPVLLVFICFLLFCGGLSGQEAEAPVSSETTASGREYKPREPNRIIDFPLTLGEIVLINIFGNVNWRLWGSDSFVANITTESMRRNLNPRDWRTWDFELGRGADTFLVNQLFHSMAGGYYFASARSNNFNFYQSILSPIIGSFTWESLCEIVSPSANDFITTSVSGIAVGEMMHRIYLELDKGGTAGKIGATFVSPTDRLTAAVRGYGPEKGPNKISDASINYGFSWINAGFFESRERITSWNMPAAFFGLDLVYGDPFTARSKTPFDQFDLNTSLVASIPLIYDFTLTSDGYLASWLLADGDVFQASNGVSLHFDLVVIDKGAIIELNNGRENLTFNANSLDYSIKWRRVINGSYAFSMKTHLGVSPWVISDYNRGIIKDDYNQYLYGGNLKLFLDLQQIKGNGGVKNGRALALSLCFYDTWNMINTADFDVNTLFLYSKLAYSFPFTEKLSFYAADSFMLLHFRLIRGMTEEFPNITRWYNSARLGMRLSL